ncbi:MAG: aminotransferase class I/II-fold pyridoxal phosphate-dependent enzyme [Chloroflexota bacterium]|nr:aminotransferase class I/II-fold pyridoxal phosphate-dependent enzyme [Chloroflexota bacterium]
MTARSSRLGTRVVRAARSLPFGAGDPVVPPLVQSVAFAHGSAAEQDAIFANERPGYVYGRYGSPTTAALESALAELDAADGAVCFATGMAAIHAYFTGCALAAGGRVVAQEDPYGATRALLERLAREQAADVVFVDPTDASAVARALEERPTRVLYVESISNPLLRVTDVAALASLAHARGAKLAVDATFASPVLTRPRELGADVVIHSLTKYVNGHGDAMGGSVAGAGDVVAEMRERAIIDGGYLPPHEAWLILRGLRTLELRVRRQCETALAVARHLAAHPKVGRVHYPGLPSHPQHELASRRFGGAYGGVVSFALKSDTREAAFRFLDALEVVASATTLGDLYSEILCPAMSSHRRMDLAERARLGISDGFLRVSCGIEDPEDLVADLDRALELT